MAATGEDPRLLARLEPDTGDVRPIVAKPGSGPPMWVLIAGLAALAVLLFVILDSRRRALNAPTVDPRIANGPVLSAAPPPLVVPPAEPPPAPVQAMIVPPAAVAPEPVRPAPPAQPQIIYVPQPTPAPVFVNPPEAPVTPPSTAPALVIDVGAAASPATASGAPAAAAATAVPGASIAGASPYGGRARAGMLANRATTIPQGMLIPAVLETALDTSRPGIARAVVSRDVRGFDGTLVLVPRGSRLVGDYRADVNAGQRRAMINWTRLVRPDGVTIALDSPAGDPLGRGGVGAQSHSNFFSRFFGSMLQTALDVGVALAGGRNQQTVIVANGADAGVQAIQPEQVTRRLTVRAGTSISVLVARDLDFTGVGSGR